MFRTVKSAWAICVVSIVMMGALLQSPAFASVVNINTADVEALEKSIKGVGPRLAEAIVKHREAFGPFRSLEDLARVKGIGARLIERNRHVLEFGASERAPATATDQRVGQAHID